MWFSSTRSCLPCTATTFIGDECFQAGENDGGIIRLRFSRICWFYLKFRFEYIWMRFGIFELDFVRFHVINNYTYDARIVGVRYWTLKLTTIWLKICFYVKLVLFWFYLMDWIESDGEAKIRVAIRNHILFANPCSSPISPKCQPQTLISSMSHIIDI